MSADDPTIHRPNATLLQGDPKTSTTATPRRLAVPESPMVVDRGGRRVLFGAGIDDFNEFDDPC